MNAEESNDIITQAESEARKYVEMFKDTQLNIAITGRSGSGKSTFVNAIRGMKNSEDGAAPTGVVETTTEPEKYTHPLNPNVTLWDLPGIGTTKFPADQYLEDVKFETYDFFIIVSADRFSENDAKLAQEIKKMGKRFYFVRSKIDNNLRDEKRDQRIYDEEKTLQKMRNNCETGLEHEGVEDPQVFLLSGVELHLYDFPALHETLERGLSSIKRDVLILALPNISSSILTKKKEVFSSQIKYYALLSGGIAAVFFLDLSLAVDLGILVCVLKNYLDGFCLDVKSFKKFSSDTERPLDDLHAGMKCPFSGKEVTVRLVLSVLVSKRPTVKMFDWIPIVGSITAYSTISMFLQEMLDLLCNDAHTFLQEVMVSVADQAL